MKTFIFLLLSVSTLSTMASAETLSDILIASRNFETKEECTTAGYCYTLGYDANGEYNFGYHYAYDCPGHKVCEFLEHTFEREDKSQYTATEDLGCNRCVVD